MENTVQKKIDYDKWIESEKLHKDLCGSYDFCKYCNKSLANPCANAVDAIQVALKETAYRKSAKK